MAAVRGIGVAVITSTSGTAPPPALSRRAARCSTPKRCCSSITTTPEAAERDRLLDERVGADEQVDLAGGQPVEHPLPLLAGDAVGEQLDGERPLAEQRRARRRAP